MNQDKGGACNNYRIEIPSESGITDYRINFQNGPIKDFGVNGLTHEALLAILIDRLSAFQVGPFACDENRFALNNLNSALYWLKTRTEKRLQRGVEGTYIK